MKVVMKMAATEQENKTVKVILKISDSKLGCKRAKKTIL